MLLAGIATEGIAAGLARHRSDDPRWAAMTRLVEGRTDALDRLAAEVHATGAQHDASGVDGVARIAAFFDRAVAHSPEASVALYSLGDPAILAQATAEIVDWLEAHELLRRDADVLDLGCGIGRVAAALAPRCRSVLGLDVSAGMVAEARRRNAALANVRFEQTSGQDLDALPDAAFDLVLAIDSFPYIVQAGHDLIDRHVQGAARVLRPGGALAVLNFSYRGNKLADQSDAAALAAAHGFALEQAGAAPFSVWDGTAFVFRR
jgi:SAM-dependent methyltransferase